MKRPRTYLVLVSAQVASLAIGLWLEARFAEAVAGYQLHQAASEVDGALGHMPSPTLRSSTPDAGKASLKQPGPMTGPRYLAFFLIAILQGAVAYLVLSREHDAVSRREVHSLNESLQRQHDLLQTRDAVIFGLATLAESRDPDTGKHLDRIALYSTRLAAALRRRSRYQGEIQPTFVKLIGISSALHDIGKVGIEDSLLLKAGSLDKAERQAMQRHATIGAECLRGIELRLGRSNFLQMAREIALSHHERWDGTGYPNGLAGGEIPLAARIVAVADVYDALSSRRAYKEAFPHERCIEIIGEGTGKQFDPVIVEVFLEIESEFRNIRQSCTEAADPQDAGRAPGRDYLDQPCAEETVGKVAPARVPKVSTAAPLDPTAFSGHFDTNVAGTD